MNLMLRLLLLGIIFTLSFSPTMAEVRMADEPMPRVRLITNLGDIVLELDHAKAPQTVENFLAYVQDGSYDGTIFHRVIDGFMIQGGGFTADYIKKPTRPPVQNEANNGLKNSRGTIAMARTNDPQSATSQFFINVVDNDFLNYREATPRGWGYAVFGTVVDGMTVVDKIRQLPTGSGGPFRRDVPRTPVVIERAVVETGLPSATPLPQGMIPKP